MLANLKKMVSCLKENQSFNFANQLFLFSQYFLEINSCLKAENELNIKTVNLIGNCESPGVSRADADRPSWHRNAGVTVS
jgi:hypothetical protein